MSDLTDIKFYPSAKRMWLCTRLYNAGKYCNITLKIMVMLQTVCKNCVQISEEEDHCQLRMSFNLWKKMKETGILIDKPKHEKAKAERTPENIVAVAESVRKAPTTSIYRQQHQFLNIISIMPYKIQLLQKLKPIDHPMRFLSAKCTCDRLTADADFSKKKSSFQMKLILILAGI